MIHNHITKSANELAREQNWVCFYTGYRMENSKARGQRAATVEHLVNRSLLNKMPLLAWKAIEQMTTVAAMAFVNNLVGDAPIKVKYEVRDECMKWREHADSLPEEMQIEFMAAVIRTVLNRYRYRWENGSTFLWRWHVKNCKPFAAEMFPKWWDLLTTEERQLHTTYKGDTLHG